MKKSTIIAYMNLRTSTEMKIAAKREELYAVQEKMFNENDDAAFLELEELERTFIMERDAYIENRDELSEILKRARKSDRAAYLEANAEFAASLPAGALIQLAPADGAEAANARLDAIMKGK